jgi:beta-glucosidase
MRRPLAATAALVMMAAAAAADDGTRRVDRLLAAMTLEEKAGQLNLLSGDHAITGPYVTEGLARAIAAGAVGGVYNAYGAAYVRGLQRLAVKQARLGVPLLVGLDVIHGYRTIFPVPLGQAASFDLDLIERAERIAAIEATAAGISLVFAPMADVSRDPRWGRVVEGAGESPWWAAEVAAARVRGLQGADLAALDTVAACPKHIAGYGAVTGGREYAGAELSERELRETHLPPFRAAVAAGARCVMAAFTTVDGVPGTANGRLLTGILRGELGFGGVVLSDFGAIGELPTHGVTADLAGAAMLALRAGTDMDMQSGAFRAHLPDLVRAGRVPAAALDAATRRVLQLKAALGLLDDPYARADPAREAAVLFTDAHREVALELAERSLVLLANRGAVLPLDRAALRRVAVIGPLAGSGADTLGSWAADGDPARAATVLDGLRAVLGRGVEVTHDRAGRVERTTPEQIASAVAAARAADAVVLVLGERSTMTGEAASRAAPGLPGDQEALARAVLAAGRPTALVVMSGRPLILGSLADEMPAILQAWFPGSQGGLAVARVLLGEAEPGGRLPMTVPRSVGQIPIHHDMRPTGRPASAEHYTSRYIDEASEPRYPFGFGLTYTDFAVAPPRLSAVTLRAGDAVIAEVEVTNIGPRAGTAVIQLYVRDPVASLSRPVRELRGVGRIELRPGERGIVRLPVTAAELAFWRADHSLAAEPGSFQIMTGPHSGATGGAALELLGEGPVPPRS